MARRLALLVFVVAVPTAVSQPKPAPQWPTLTTPMNLGVAPGQHDLTLTGTRLTDIVSVDCPTPGISFRVTPKQSDATKLHVTATVGENVPIGLHPIRVRTKTGLSDFRPLCVDPLPAIVETDGNTKREAAQAVTLPCVVTGAVAPEAADYFKFQVTAGQTLTFEAVAKRIGSPLDPVLVIHDMATGRELPGVYADDTPGLQSDARLTHTFKDNGEFVVEIRDATYRGGSDSVYRLRIGDFPTAMTAFPLIATTGATVKVAATGPDADRATPVSLKIEAPATYFTPRGKSGLPGWSVPVRASEFPEGVEVEPNDEPKTANRVMSPGGVSARFASRNDKDHFVVAAKKGQKLEVIARAAEVYAPTEVYLRVLDGKGAELAKSDPMKPVARIDFTPSDDGDYVIAAEHLNFFYGPTEVYHLSVRTAGPDFDVTVGMDRFCVPAGGIGVLPIVGVSRFNGFNSPITIKLEGIGGVTGTLTIPPSANPTPQAPIYLAVTAANGAKPVSGIARVIATGGTVTKRIAATNTIRESLGGLTVLPPELSGMIAGAVVEKSPFAVEVKIDGPKAIATVFRSASFDAEVKIDLIALPSGVTSKPVTIGKEKDSSPLELTVKDAKPGLLLVRGTAKVGRTDFEVIGKPVEWSPPAAKK
jgi:hypothetical protein